MRRLPLAFSCERRWSEMTGGSTVRDCEDCGCQVLNLSSLDEESAKSLLAGQQGRVCVRFRSRRGRIVFSKIRSAVAVAAAALLLSAPAAADTTPPQTPARRTKAPEKKKKHSSAPKKQEQDEMGALLNPTF